MSTINGNLNSKDVNLAFATVQTTGTTTNNINNSTSSISITPINSNATTNTASTSGANNSSHHSVAVEFQKELNSVLESKPPISKDKMNQIVTEAIRSHRNYKHVVYYVETFY